jgi:hypothetical protein
MATATKVDTCRFVLRSGLLNGMEKYLVEQGCNALAGPSGYCPIHERPPRPAPKAPRVKVDRDVDVLPWSAEDQKTFDVNDRKRVRKTRGRR